MADVADTSEAARGFDGAKLIMAKPNIPNTPAQNGPRTSAAFDEGLLTETAESDAAEAAMDALIAKREALLIDGTDAEINALDNQIGSERLRMERAEKRIKKLKEDLQAVQQEEAAAALAAEGAAIEAEVAELERVFPELRRAMAFVASTAHKERNLRELIGKHRAKPVAKQIEPPFRALRYSPAVTPLAALGNVIKTRAKDLRSAIIRVGGPDAYEMYEAPAELPPFSPERDFDQEPLFRTTEIPRLCRDDIFYSVPFDQKV